MKVTFRTHSISPGDHRSSRGSGPAVPDEVLATTGLGGSARQMSASVFHSSSGRPDCVAGHVRFELRNVAANYLFERSHRFPGIQPNSGHRDYSRLSCGVAETQLGPSARISAAFLARAQSAQWCCSIGRRRIISGSAEILAMSAMRLDDRAYPRLRQTA
jgi:hypothetical protein